MALALSAIGGIVAEALVYLVYSLVIILMSKSEWRFLKNIFLVSHMYAAKEKTIVYSTLSVLAYYGIAKTGSKLLILLYSFSFMTTIATMLINMSAKINPMEATSTKLRALYFLTIPITFDYVVLMSVAWVRLLMACCLLALATYYLYKTDAWDKIFKNWKDTYEYLYPVVPFAATLVTLLM